MERILGVEKSVVNLCIRLIGKCGGNDGLSAKHIIERTCFSVVTSY